MICWKCGHLNEETRQFCEKCGADIWHADPTPNLQQQSGNPQDRNQQNGNINPQSRNQQNGMQQNRNASENRQAGANYRGNPAQASSGGSWSQPVSEETENNSLVKIAALVFAVLYLIKTIMYIPTLFVALGRVFEGWRILVSIVDLLFSIAWMLSLVLLVGSLFLLAMRRTKGNGEHLYLAVVLAEVLHIAVAFLRLLWRVILIFALYRGRMTAGAFLHELSIALFTALVLVLLFALYAREGQKPLLGKTKDELKQMVKDLSVVLPKEFEILSAQFTKSRKSGEGRYEGQASFHGGSYEGQASSGQGGNEGQASFDQGSYGGQVSSGQSGNEGQASFGQGSYGGQTCLPPGMAGEPLKTNRSLFLLIVLTILTCGIYSWYFYYSIAKDANIICAGDGEETAGLLKHILLVIVTCGIYEYIWQCQFADRLRRNASRYGVNVDENGTTVILWMFPGSCCCGLGAFVAYHIQIKNINKMARAYNEKMFAQYGTNR